MVFFFFNDTATTEIYTLSLHDALPILAQLGRDGRVGEIMQRNFVTARPDETLTEVFPRLQQCQCHSMPVVSDGQRSEEHTSELQSRQYLVCRLLLEKKKKKTNCILHRC